MSWPFSQRVLETTSELLAERTRLRTGSTRRVNREQALRHSAAWACLRLRADLISTMPVDVFRRVAGVQVEQTKPPVLVEPGGRKVRMTEWMYSTQFDLDSCGNTVGIITARDGLGLPARIELQNIDDVTFIGKGPELTKVRIGGTEYEPEQIWHEKQFTVSGVPIGLSPIAYAALTLDAALSAKEFAAAWFSNSTMPGGHLKNVAKTLDRKEAIRVKSAFKGAVEAGDVWVSGKDWEFNMLSAKASESQFLETQSASVPDICRFLGVPGDMIDAEVSSGTVTYANVTQRNLQLLIMNIGPAIVRREEALSYGLLPQPRYVKLNTSALLRMDVKSRYEAHKVAIDSRIYPPSRALDMENMAPLTPEEVAEFATLFPTKVPATPAPAQNEQAELLATVRSALERELSAPVVNVHLAERETSIHNHMPGTTVENHVDVQPAEVRAPDVHVDVAPADVVVREVSTPEVIVNVAGPEVPITVEPTPVEIRNDVTVQPADVEVLPTEPKTRTIERDALGNIVAVHEE